MTTLPTLCIYGKTRTACDFPVLKQLQYASYIGVFHDNLANFVLAMPFKI